MKKIPIKYLPLLGIALLIIIIGLFLIRAGHESLQDAVFTDIVSKEGLSIKGGLHFFGINTDDDTKWELKADEAKSSIDGTQTQLSKFKFKLESAGKFSIEIEGDRADYNKTADEIVLKGALKGLTDKGYRINTDQILFNRKEGYLKTDEAVKLTGPFFVTTGKGLFVDLKKETLEILSDVKTIIENGSLGL